MESATTQASSSSRGASSSAPPFAVVVAGPGPARSSSRRKVHGAPLREDDGGGEAEPVGLEEVLLRVAAGLRGRLGRHEPLDGLPVVAEPEQRVQEEGVLVGRPLLPRPRDRVRLPGPRLLPHRRRRRSSEIPRTSRSRRHHLVCARSVSRSR
jgi:hypothetical protein